MIAVLVLVAAALTYAGIGWFVSYRSLRRFRLQQAKHMRECESANHPYYCMGEKRVYHLSDNKIDFSDDYLQGVFWGVLLPAQVVRSVWNNVSPLTVATSVAEKAEEERQRRIIVAGKGESD